MTSNELEIFKQSILDDVRVMMQTTGQVTQYIGARYVPLFAEPLDWDNQKEYEPLTIVLHKGNSYTSRQFVPKDVDIFNTDFWANTGNYNAQIEQYRKEVENLFNQIKVVSKTYSSINSMKNDASLQVGDYAITASFYENEKLGGGIYKITSSGTPNEMDVIKTVNGNAHLQNYNNVCQLGASPSLNDCSDIFTYAFSKNRVMTIPDGITLKFTKPVNAENEAFIMIEGNNAILKGASFIVNFKNNKFVHEFSNIPVTLKDLIIFPNVDDAWLQTDNTTYQPVLTTASRCHIENVILENRINLCAFGENYIDNCIFKNISGIFNKEVINTSGILGAIYYIDENGNAHNEPTDGKGYGDSYVIESCREFNLAQNYPFIVCKNKSNISFKSCIQLLIEIDYNAQVYIEGCHFEYDYTGVKDVNTINSIVDITSSFFYPTVHFSKIARYTSCSINPGAAAPLFNNATMENCKMYYYYLTKDKHFFNKEEFVSNGGLDSYVLMQHTSDKVNYLSDSFKFENETVELKVYASICPNSKLYAFKIEETINVVNNPIYLRLSNLVNYYIEIYVKDGSKIYYYAFWFKPESADLNVAVSNKMLDFFNNATLMPGIEVKEIPVYQSTSKRLKNGSISG